MSPYPDLRRISPIAVRSSEGPLTEPTAAAQVRERERVFMPLNGGCWRRLTVGCGQLVYVRWLRKGRSEVSYLSPVRLLNATGSWLNL